MLEAAECGVVDVEGVQMALVLECGPEEQRLPAGAGAEVKNMVPRVHIQTEAHQLEPLVLDLEESRLVARQPEDVGPTTQDQAIGCMGCGPARDALRPQALAQRLCAQLQAVGADGDGTRQVARRGEGLRLLAQRTAEFLGEPVRVGKARRPILGGGWG